MSPQGARAPAPATGAALRMRSVLSDDVSCAGGDSVLYHWCHRRCVAGGTCVSVRMEGWVSAQGIIRISEPCWRGTGTVIHPINGRMACTGYHPSPATSIERRRARNRASTKASCYSRMVGVVIVIGSLPLLSTRKMTALKCETDAINLFSPFTQKIDAGCGARG